MALINLLTLDQEGSASPLIPIMSVSPISVTDQALTPMPFNSTLSGYMAVLIVQLSTTKTRYVLVNRKENILRDVSVQFWSQDDRDRFLSFINLGTANYGYRFLEWTYRQVDVVTTPF